jgi:hypothetical protein
MFGYHGKVLRIDLSTQQTVWEPIEDQVLCRVASDRLHRRLAVVQFHGNKTQEDGLCCPDSYRQELLSVSIGHQ